MSRLGQAKHIIDIYKKRSKIKLAEYNQNNKALKFIRHRFDKDHRVKTPYLIANNSRWSPENLRLRTDILPINMLS